MIRRTSVKVVMETWRKKQRVAKRYRPPNEAGGSSVFPTVDAYQVDKTTSTQVFLPELIFSPDNFD
jgi:hypothetical protein